MELRRVCRSFMKQTYYSQVGRHMILLVCCVILYLLPIILCYTTLYCTTTITTTTTTTTTTTFALHCIVLYCGTGIILYYHYCYYYHYIYTLYKVHILMSILHIRVKLCRWRKQWNVSRKYAIFTPHKHLHSSYLKQWGSWEWRLIFKPVTSYS